MSPPRETDLGAGRAAGGTGTPGESGLGARRAEDGSAVGTARETGFALLAEVLFIGVLVCLAALPVVTVLAATSAGSVLMRELVESQRTPTVRRFARLLWAALREPVALLLPVLVLVVGGLDTLALLAGVPGGRVLGPVVLTALVGAVLVGVRGAARWRPGRRWGLAAAVRAVRTDWVGSLLLVAALLMAVLIGSQAPAFLVVLPGLVVMAAVAVDRRVPHSGRRVPHSRA
jgi:hypothetical protein